MYKMHNLEKWWRSKWTFLTLDIWYYWLVLKSTRRIQLSIQNKSQTSWWKLALAKWDSLENGRIEAKCRYNWE